MLHKTLKKQIEKTTKDGVVDTTQLLNLISQTYEKIDIERSKNEQSCKLLASETDKLNEELEKAILKLKDQNIRFKSAMENMFHGLCMFDENNRIVIWNQKFLEIFHLTEDQIQPELTLFQCIIRSPTYNHKGEDYCRDLALELSEMLNENKPKEFVAKLPDKRILKISHQPMPYKGSVQTIEDISDKVQTEKKIRHMAHHDALTGLANRVLFNERLQEVAQRYEAFSEHSAILCMDLDYFKQVNDTLGHAVGDRLLIEVTERIKALIGKTDTFARLGGDEFAIIQNNIKGKEKTEELAKAIIEDICIPFNIDGNEIFLGVSIGIVIFGDGYTIKPYELLRNADLALYNSKTAGKGVYSFYREEFSHHIQLKKKRETELRLALSENHFEVYYQPQVRTSNGKIIGVEALIRWNHPTQGQVTPESFIRISEEIGLINPMTEFTLNKACDDLIEFPDLKLAVNLSPLQFRKSGIYEMIEDVLKNNNFSPKRLEFEITENALLVDCQATFNTLERLKSLGISIAMDDFGTGYSSLSYLRSFPFDKLKIDQSFIKELGYNTEANSIVQAVIRLGKSLGMKINAEGVESQTQAALLKLEGCDELQGYYFGKPMKITDLKKHLHTPQNELFAMKK